MKKIYALILAVVMVISLTACGESKSDNTPADNEEISTPIQENTEETEAKTSPDKYTWYIKNYVGKNVASIGYTSMGGDRLDSYGSGYLRLVLLTPNGEYIDIEDDDSMKAWRVVGQSLEPNTEIKYTFQVDSEGEEYDNLVAHQNIEEIVLALAHVGENAEAPELTVINPSPDRYITYIRDYTGRTLAQCGYISTGGDLCNAYGNAYIRLNVCADDGSYVDFNDSSSLKNYVVTGQSVEPNTELTMTYMLNGDGKEYDNLIETQNIEEIDLYVTRVNNYVDADEDSDENIEDASAENMTESTEDDTTSTEEIKEEKPEESLVDGMRPEFKEAMDSYEAFYDEYCDFMKKYNENPSDLILLAEYMDMLEEAEEMDKKFDEWEDGDLNDAELKYYLDVNNRVMQKMLDVI